MAESIGGVVTNAARAALSYFTLVIHPDADHYYNEPKSEDLKPIFNAIGSQLTGGSRLVE